MKKIQRSLVFGLLVVHFLFSASELKAQKKYWDVIMLKNAEVIRGTIIKTIPNESVTILAGDSLSRIILSADIELISKEIRRNYYTQNAKKPNQKSQEVEKNIYYQGVISAGYRFNMQADGYTAVSFNFINGVGLAELASIGVGIGIRAPLDGGNILIPLFFDFRTSLLRARISPLLAFGVGPTLGKNRVTSSQIFSNFTHEFESKLKFLGSMMYAELGVRIGRADQTNFMFTVGIEKFELKGRRMDGSDLDASMLTLNIALAF